MAGGLEIRRAVGTTSGGGIGLGYGSGNPSGRSEGNDDGGKVLGHDGSRTHHRVVTDADAGADDHAPAKPDGGSDGDGLGTQGPPPDVIWDRG